MQVSNGIIKLMLRSCCRVYLVGVHVLGEVGRLHDPLPCKVQREGIIGVVIPLRMWGALPWRLRGTVFFLLLPLNMLCFCVISLLEGFFGFRILGRGRTGGQRVVVIPEKLGLL